MADRIRNLKIKTNVVKRIIKEKSTYEVEVTQTEERIEKMKSAGKDEYDIKKMGEVLAESRMMIPDCLKRLSNAYDDLKNILNSEVDLKETEEYKQGLSVSEEAHGILGK